MAKKAEGNVWVTMWAYRDYADEVRIAVFNSYKASRAFLLTLDTTTVVWSDIKKKEIRDD